MKENKNQKKKPEVLGMKNKKGITLIALIITIIILLILAGVSLNAIVGDNGVITNAMNAKKTSEEVYRKEQIKMMIMGYVLEIDTKDSLREYLVTRKGKEIEDVLLMPNPDGIGEMISVVKKEGYYYSIIEEDGNYIVEEINTDTTNIGEGLTLATKDNFKGGEMDFNPGEGGKSTLVFADEIDDEFCFDIKSGEVTIYINSNMTLTNENVVPKRSAINIEPYSRRKNINSK